MISSVDANLLVYAHNARAPEHKPAFNFINRLLRPGSDEQILLLHQTIFEVFSILTNPQVVSNPNANEAWNICLYYFSHPAIQTGAYEAAVFRFVQEIMNENPGRGKRFFDLLLAATLKYHGVERFYTRNEKHFRSYTFLEVINPL